MADAPLAPWLEKTKKKPAAGGAADSGADFAPWLPKKGVKAKAPPVPATPQDFPIDTSGAKPGFLTSQGIEPGAAGAGVRQAVAAGEPKSITLDSPEFDPVSGLDFASTRDWLTLDNDQERQKYLERGKKAGQWTDYGQTEDTGQWFVVPKGGKPTAIMGANLIKNLGAGIAAHPGEAGGMALATVLFPEAAPEELAGGSLAGLTTRQVAKALWKRFVASAGYAGGRAAVTGAGAVAGKGLDEAIKAARSAYSKTPGEEAQALGEAGLGGATTEFGIRGLGGIVKALGQGYSKFIEPELQSLTGQALREGGRPSIRQATGGVAKLFPFEQAIAERVFGNPAEKANLKMMTDQMTENLVQAGWSRPEAEKLVAQIRKEPGQVGDPTATTERLQAGAAARTERSAAAVDVERAGLQQELDQQMTAIERSLGSNDPKLQQQVQQDISAARTSFGRAAQRLYAVVDRIVGNEPLVSTAGIRAEAQRIIDEIPKTAPSAGKPDPMAALTGAQPGETAGAPVLAIPPEIQKATALPDKITFADAQRLRSAFTRFGLAKDLTPGIEEREWTALGDSVDTAIAQSDARDGAQALRAADDFYKQGIRRFQQVSVKQLGKEAEISHFADPEKVATQILRPGYTAQALRIKSLVSPETWKKVGAAYWSDVTKKAETAEIGPNGRSVINGKKLYDALKKAGKGLDVAFGPQKAAEMRQTAQRLAAMDGKIDPTNLTSDNFMQRINTYLRGQEQHEAMMKDNFVQMLTGNRQIDRSDAVSYIMGDPNRVRQAKEFYGEASPEWDNIRRDAMVNMLRSTVKPGEEILAKSLTSGGLSSVIKATNTRVLDELFGADVASDLRQLAKKIDFMTGQPKGAGTAAFAIASIVLHPLAHIGTIANLAVGANLMRSKPFLKWLVLGIDGDSEALRKAGAIARTMGYTLEPQTGIGKGEAKFSEAIASVLGQDVSQGIQTDPIINAMRGRGFTATPDQQ